MLAVLTKPSQSTDLSLIDIVTRQYTPDGVTFCLVALLNNLGKASFFFPPTFPTNSQLCPVITLRAYEERTESLRNGETKLFLGLIKVHKFCTVA